MLGLCVGLVLANNLAEGQAEAEQFVPGIWPPPVDRIVNVTGIADFRKKDDTMSIYTVPEKYWLVVTDLRTVKTKKLLYPEPNLEMRLPGAKQGTLVVPWELADATFAANSAPGVGYKFPPGSEVVLCRQAEGSSRLDCYFFMAGYLTR